MYLLDAFEAYFGSPGMETFDGSVVYWLDNNFLTSMRRPLDSIGDSECDFSEGEVPRIVPKLMDVSSQRQ